MKYLLTNHLDQLKKCFFFYKIPEIFNCFLVSILNIFFLFFKSKLKFFISSSEFVNESAKLFILYFFAISIHLRSFWSMFSSLFFYLLDEHLICLKISWAYTFQ